MSDFETSALEITIPSDTAEARRVQDVLEHGLQNLKALIKMFSASDLRLKKLL